MLSYTKNDYLLAAMLICLDIHLSATRPKNISTDHLMWGRDQRDEMLRALEGSYHIWKEYSKGSAEALKASEALATMLAKLRPESGITTKYGPLRSLNCPSSERGRVSSIRSRIFVSYNLGPPKTSSEPGSHDNIDSSAGPPPPQIFVEPQFIDWVGLQSGRSWNRGADFWGLTERARSLLHQQYAT